MPDLHDPNYPYTKKDLTIDKSHKPYPVIEQSINGELFPLCPNDSIDTSFYEKQE